MRTANCPIGSSRLAHRGRGHGLGRRSRNRQAAAEPGRQGLGDEWRQYDQRTLLYAEADRHHQRQAAQGSLDDPPQGLRARRQVFVRGDAARQRRHHVYQHRERRCLRARCQDRPDPLGALVRHRPDDLDRLLRLAQPWAGDGRRDAVHRPDGRECRRARHQDRQGGVADPGRGLAQWLRDHQRAALFRRDRL